MTAFNLTNPTNRSGERNSPIIPQYSGSTFLGSANIITHKSQCELHERVFSSSVETRDLIYQILINQEELRQVHEMHSAGKHIAESIMEAGQLVRPTKLILFLVCNEFPQELRQLREDTASRRDLTMTSTSPSQPADAQRYLQYQRGLLDLHRLTGIPPSVKVLNGEVTKTSELPVAGGTYSDIWLGAWLGEKKVMLDAHTV